MMNQKKHTRVSCVKKSSEKKSSTEENNLEYCLDLTLRINRLDIEVSKEETDYYKLKISLKNHRKEHTLLLKEREPYLLKLSKDRQYEHEP